MAKYVSTGVRRTVEWQIEQGKRHRTARGHNPDWPSEALDAYLSGMSKSDIGRVFDVSPAAVDNAISKEALYRLLRLAQANELSDHPGLQATGYTNASRMQQARRNIAWIAAWQDEANASEREFRPIRSPYDA